MKLHLLIGIMVSGALLAGLAAVGIGLSENTYQRGMVYAICIQGMVVFWLGVIASASYLYLNRNR